MGNCLDLEKQATTWVDEEAAWKSQSPGRHYEKQQRKNGGGKISFLRPDGGRSTTTEIKIKISKKQLEELLRQVDGERVPLRQMLVDLPKKPRWEDQCEPEADQGGHGRPELQSIPELPE